MYHVECQDKSCGQKISTPSRARALLTAQSHRETTGHQVITRYSVRG